MTSERLKRKARGMHTLLIFGWGLILGSLLGTGYTHWQQAQGVPPQPQTQVIHKIRFVVPVVSETKYVIKKGDTLSKIAERSCDDISAIAKRNGIKNPHYIRAGATITVVKKCSSSEKFIQHVSPGKFAISGRASQEKRLIHPESFRKLSSTSTLNDRSLSSVDTLADCRRSSFKKRIWREQTLAIRDCVMNRYGESIRRASQETYLAEELILAVMIVESGGNPSAISPTGCRGLMQLLTSTAAQYGVPRNRIFDPDVNIRGGARILADYLHRYAHGDLDRALASYNKGPNAVSRLIRDENFAPSSHFYVVRVKTILRLLEADRKR